MKTIDFETHFVTAEWVEATYANPGYPRFVDDLVTGRRRMYYLEDAFERLGLAPPGQESAGAAPGDQEPDAPERTGDDG